MSLSIETSFFLIQYPSHVTFQNKIYIENFFIDLVKNISEIFWDMYFFPVFHSV
jgi:hypothetical protein